MTSGMSAGGSEDMYAVYTAELRLHAVDLVWLGYCRLNGAAFSTAEEDVITGELVREMRNVLEDPVSPPPWAEHYSVNEQQRANVAGKEGKRRPIIDVEFERHCRGKRPRFRFEAKRLHSASDRGKYLGEEGLAAFLDGYYPSTHGEAGMLGYVQGLTPEAWAEKLSLELATAAELHRVTSDGQWLPLPKSNAGCSPYRSVHNSTDGLAITVIHVLLDFTA